MPDRADLAFRAASEGATFAHDQYRTDLTVETKDSKMDYVTEADTGAQHRVIETIREKYPEAVVVGEEEDERKRAPTDGDAWVIDPIDGTTNFVRGVPIWATSVAAIRDGEPVAAATSAPALGNTYVADADDATENDRPISVSDRADVETFVVAPILRYGPERDQAFGVLLAELVRSFGDLRRFGCAQVTLAMVAAGTLDATVSTQPEPNPWDTIAGVHLVRRAGGTVTDVHGDPWTVESEGIVASNGEAHEEVVEVVEPLD